jgi:hypothetical protein
MTTISWTVEAEDKTYGKIELYYTEDDGILHLIRPYTYITLDSNGKPRYTSSSLNQDIPWDNIPPDIQAALVFIDTYTKQQIEVEAQEIIAGLPV